MLDDPEAVVHHRGADLDRAGAEEEELGGVLPRLDAADPADRHADLGSPARAATMFSAIGLTAGPQ